MGIFDQLKLSNYGGTCFLCAKSVTQCALTKHEERWRSVCLDCGYGKSRSAKSVEQHLVDWKGRGFYDYQQRGIAWLNTQKSCILADDQGLGKTVQLIATVSPGVPIMICCPAIAKTVWAEHIEKLKPNYEVAVGSGLEWWQVPEDYVATIFNYDILPSYFKDQFDNYWTNADLGNSKPILIFDEVHALKNFRAERTVRGKALANSTLNVGGRVIIATGTPIKKDSPDLWNLLGIIDRRQDAFRDYDEFCRMLGADSYGYHDKWNGSVHSDTPHRLRKVMLRRLKIDVLPDLAEKVYETVFVDIDEATLKECDEVIDKLSTEHGIDLEEDTLQAIENSKSVPFELISTVCRSLAVAKIPALKKLLEKLENEGIKSPLVWSRHKDPLKFVADLPGWEKIDGETIGKKRKAIESDYQAGALKGLGLSINAANTAITLTYGNVAIFVDRSWCPADNLQAEDRLHRIGQNASVCRYIFIVANHYLDRRLSELLGQRTITFKDLINDESEG